MVDPADTERTTAANFDDEIAGANAEQMPRVRFTRARLYGSIVFVVSVVAFLYFVLPKLLGLQETWNRLQQGNVWWLAVALVLETLSFASYIALFRAVFIDTNSRIGWRESYQITMAGLMATRLFAAAGAGGIALTAWALRRSGMRSADARDAGWSRSCRCSTASTWRPS